MAGVTACQEEQGGAKSRAGGPREGCGMAVSGSVTIEWSLGGVSGAGGGEDSPGARIRSPGELPGVDHGKGVLLGGQEEVRVSKLNSGGAEGVVGTLGSLDMGLPLLSHPFPETRQGS